jgi:hypothetical protein
LFARDKHKIKGKVNLAFFRALMPLWAEVTWR